MVGNQVRAEIALFLPTQGSPQTSLWETVLMTSQSWVALPVLPSPLPLSSLPLASSSTL